MDTQEAYDVLLHSERFSGPMVGRGARMPDAVKAFLTLLRTPQSDELFKNLLVEATLPGQLYALCGVYFTDQKAFSESMEKYRDREDIVDTQFGCIRGTSKVSDLVESRHVSVVRLDVPEQTLEEWRERPKGQDAILDISGGGYPAHFREFADRI